MTPDPERVAVECEHGDAIYEHKKGKIWALVGRMERENKRYAIRSGCYKRDCGERQDDT